MLQAMQFTIQIPLQVNSNRAAPGQLDIKLRTQLPHHLNIFTLRSLCVKCFSHSGPARHFLTDSNKESIQIFTSLPKLTLPAAALKGNCHPHSQLVISKWSLVTLGLFAGCRFPDTSCRIPDSRCWIIAAWLIVISQL